MSVSRAIRINFGEEARILSSRPTIVERIIKSIADAVVRASNMTTGRNQALRKKLEKP